MSLTSCALCACFVLASCDQFVVIGVRPSVHDSGAQPPPASASDAAAPAFDAAPPLANDAMISDASSELDAGDAATECMAPDGGVLGCDPLSNPVCSATVVDNCCAAELLQRCAVDPFALFTGSCITQSLPVSELGQPCIYSGATDSCPPTSACYLGVCREVCLCDADCSLGCCSDTFEGTGFGLCGSC